MVLIQQNLVRCEEEIGGLFQYYQLMMIMVINTRIRFDSTEGLNAVAKAMYTALVDEVIYRLAFPRFAFFFLLSSFFFFNYHLISLLMTMQSKSNRMIAHAKYTFGDQVLMISIVFCCCHHIVDYDVIIAVE